jgi:hypothetical protein
MRLANGQRAHAGQRTIPLPKPSSQFRGVDRSHRDSGSDTEVSGLCGRLRGDWDQRWVFTLEIRPTAIGNQRFVRRLPLLSRDEIGRSACYPNHGEEAPMNGDLSLDEQREFWVQLFGVVVRREARKRRELEVALELLEDVRQTEPSQI